MHGLVVSAMVASSLFAWGYGGDRKGGPSIATRQSSQHDTGGERSIEGFGVEAHSSTRAALLVAHRDYLKATAAHDYRAACSRLSATVQESLAQLANVPRGRSQCTRTLPELLSVGAAAISRAQTGEWRAGSATAAVLALSLSTLRR